ncbi:MAG: radical SAM protein [Thermoplasmatota archaeon]
MERGELKARLLSAGEILIPAPATLPALLTRSSAGPGAGCLSVFLDIRGCLVRLEAVRTGGAGRAWGAGREQKPQGPGRSPGRAASAPPARRPRIEPCGGGYALVWASGSALSGVRVVPGNLHAPRQAFINLHNECRFRCAFCALPRLPRRPWPGMDGWLRIISGAVQRGRVDAVAITTGVPHGVSGAVGDVAELARRVRSAFPELPIGVEPYATSPRDIRRLKSSGATELKLNIQCATEELMERVCPGLDWGGIWAALEAGVEVFGRNRVCSNLILGLGESDREALAAAERLARIGALVNLRPLRVSPWNTEPLREALGRAPRTPSPPRLLRLALAQKKIFQRHSLDPSVFRTMCHRCTACELAPFRDI